VDVALNYPTGVPVSKSAIVTARALSHVDACNHAGKQLPAATHAPPCVMHDIWRLLISREVPLASCIKTNVFAW
jgi:hypothetical protein